MLVYGAARWFGAEWLGRRLDRFGGAEREQKLRAMYEKRGMAALFVSRFLPGIRALVPPLAGGLRIPAGRVAIVIAVASAIWYGVVTWIAYRVGADWDALQARIGQLSRTTAIIAASIVALAVAVWFVRRKGRRPSGST